jgi:hypothetical protein
VQATPAAAPVAVAGVETLPSTSTQADPMSLFVAVGGIFVLGAIYLARRVSLVRP